MRFLALLLIPIAAADPLPRQILPAQAKLQALPDEDGRKIWDTRFFQIDSDVELKPNELLRLAQVADTTALAVKAHPLPLFSPPGGTRPTLSIIADPKDYRAAGGFSGSAGFYVSHKAAVLIRGDYLVRPQDPARSRLPPRHDEDLVVHEIVHLCMHRVNQRMPQWFLEGTADYFASAHQGAGRFNFSDMDKSVRDHLRIRLSPDDPDIPLVPVADLIGLNGRDWLRYIESLPVDERYHAYATALLLAHYHFHGGTVRRDALRKALEAQPRRGRISLLIPTGAATATQDALLRYWKPRGLSLKFPVEP